MRFINIVDLSVGTAITTCVYILVGMAVMICVYFSVGTAITTCVYILVGMAVMTYVCISVGTAVTTISSRATRSYIPSRCWRCCSSRPSVRTSYVTSECKWNYTQSRLLNGLLSFEYKIQVVAVFLLKK